VSKYDATTTPNDGYLSFKLNDINTDKTLDISIDEFGTFSLNDLIDSHLNETNQDQNTVRIAPAATETQYDIVLSLDSLIMRDPSKHVENKHNNANVIFNEHELAGIPSSHANRPNGLLVPARARKPPINFLKNLVRKNLSGFVHMLFDSNDGNFMSFGNESFDYDRQVSFLNSKKFRLPKS
jgi:hypothetical protein